MSGVGGEASNVHGTAIVLRGLGILIRGPSGAGKSLLALEFLADAGRFPDAGLVADDRVDIVRHAESVLMSAPLSLAGLIELRGFGIIHRPQVQASALALVVDLVDYLERMPDPGAFTTNILGLPVRRCPVPRRGVIDNAHQKLLVEEALASLASAEKIALETPARCDKTPPAQPLQPIAL